MTPETAPDVTGVPVGAATVPEGLPDTLADPAPLGQVDAGEPLYVVVNEVGEHLSHHRTPEGAQSAWDCATDAVGIHETVLHR